MQNVHKLAEILKISQSSMEFHWLMCKRSFSYVKSQLKKILKNCNFAKMNFERGHADQKKMISYDI